VWGSEAGGRTKPVADTEEATAALGSGGSLEFLKLGLLVQFGFLQKPGLEPSGCRARSQCAKMSRLPRMVIGNVTRKGWG
jgi:hypothetical protein